VRLALRTDQLALVTTGATVALMALGSLVHGTGSSLACPDWPLCNGTALPRMVGGVAFEHSHRLLAMTVVVLTATLAGAVWRRAHAANKGLAAAACVLLAMQAALGATTVLLRLPPMVSVAHLATAMAFLVVVAALSARLGGLGAARTPASARHWFTASIALVYVQIVEGAVVRHSGAALVCPGLLVCAGGPSPDGSLQLVHLLHRASGVVVLVAVFSSVLVVRKTPDLTAWQLAQFLSPAVLVLAQVALGLAVVATRGWLSIVTAHHVTAALLLVALVLARARCATSARVLHRPRPPLAGARR
jgi:heme A synthase